MTETSGKFYKLQIPPNADEAFESLNYKGMGKDAAIVFGPECEFFLCKVENGRMKPISCHEAEDFMQKFEEFSGAPLHQEAIASHFELNSGPMELDNFREKFETYFDSVRKLYQFADRCGYRVIPSSHAPHIEGADDVMDQLVDRRRIQLLVPEGRRYFGDSLLEFANLTAGIHVSMGYKDTDQFYEELRRTYYLSPFIYALSNNGFPFWKGMQDAKGVVPRMAVIEEFNADPHGGRTGVDPLFYDAVDGEDFLKRYIDRMMHSTLVCYYPDKMTDEEKAEGRDEPKLRSTAELGAAPNHPTSFALLQQRGLNTLSTLQFAASTWWYGVKVQDIPGLTDKNGIPMKRLEDRIWNAGTWQLPTALLMRALMTLEPDCGREVDNLLAEFGFRPEGPAIHPESAENLKEATANACHSGKNGLDFKFGRGTAKEFGRAFTAILKKYAARHDLADYLAPMDYITRTGRTDGVVLSELCKTPEDIAAFVKSYDVRSLASARNCFGMLQEQGKLPNPAVQRERGSSNENIGPQPKSAPEGPQ